MENYAQNEIALVQELMYAGEYTKSNDSCEFHIQSIIEPLTTLWMVRRNDVRSQNNIGYFYTTLHYIKTEFHVQINHWNTVYNTFKTPACLHSTTHITNTFSHKLFHAAIVNNSPHCPIASAHSLPRYFTKPRVTTRLLSNGISCSRSLVVGAQQRVAVNESSAHRFAIIITQFTLETRFDRACMVVCSAQKLRAPRHIAKLEEVVVFVCMCACGTYFWARVCVCVDCVRKFTFCNNTVSTIYTIFLLLDYRWPNREG